MTIDLRLFGAHQTTFTTLKHTTTPMTMAVNLWNPQPKIVSTQYVTRILCKCHLNLLQIENEKLHRFAHLKYSPSTNLSLPPCS